MPQPSTIKYYSIYFPGHPADRAYDTAFLSTDKKELEKEYADYLIEGHLGYLIDQYNKLCESANNPTAMITTDDADTLYAFAQRLHEAGPAEVFALDCSYVKEVDYPHFHIPIVNKDGETIELGQFTIKYGRDIDAVLILNKPKLTSEDEQIINDFLKRKNYNQIDWQIHNPKTTFMVPAVWKAWGRVPVEATDIDDLKAKLKDPEFIANLTAPQDSDHYLDDSFEVDWEGDAIDESGASYELTAKPVTTQTSNETGNKIISNNATSAINDKIINITVNGSADFIETATGAVAVTGNVTQIQTASGNITISGDVTNATTMSGDISAKKIGSATSMSGDVKIK